MLIFNQKDNVIKLQFVFGEMQGIYLPRKWKTCISRHFEATNFMNLYKVWSYYKYCISLDNEELKDYGTKTLLDSQYSLNEYDIVYKERYKELFSDLEMLIKTNNHANL